jgi:outer membrane receptor protein involved in Fe transport
MGSNGTATVNLRGLGVTRTLVLVNGRRLLPGDPVSSPVADLNAIPSALIKRVDVLTGGASATYGADAVAGVVNFILDDKFEGLKLDAQYSLIQHNNHGEGDVRSALAAQGQPDPEGSFSGGGTTDLSLVFGSKLADGAGHITLYGGYRKTEPIYQSKYNYSACSLNEVKAPASAFSCGGSGTTAPGGQFIAYTDSSLTHQIDSDPTQPGNQAFTVNQSVPGGAFRTFTSPQDLFNTGPYNYLQRNDVRYTGGGFAQYEFNKAATLYGEFSFMDDQTNAIIAPSGIFSSATYTTPCSNPLMSAQERGLICPAPGQTNATMVIGRRNVEGGGRNADLRHTSYRGVIGMKGAITDSWSYDVYGQFGRTIYSQTYFNEFSKSRIQRALNVTTDPKTGQAVCTSVLDGTDPGCVPYNLFVPNGITPAALNYLQSPLLAKGDNTEKVLSGSITGDLGDTFKSPWSENKIGVAFGAEYRKESLSLTTDAAWQAGDGAGQNALLPQNGSFNVKEAFAEIRVPLIEHSFVDRASVEAGYRYSKYSTAGATNTYKVGLEVAPIRQITLRGSYNRAVRAPNITELFAPARTGTFNGIDPCAGIKPTFTLAQCQLEGVTSAEYGNVQANPAGQYQSFGGGNAELRPEVADTFTAGFVLQPSGALQGLSVTLDYFNIKVNNVINTVGPQILLNLCGQTADPAYCSTIHRQPGTGSLYLDSNYYVDDRLTNIGSLQTSGVDVSAAYQFRFNDLGLNNDTRVDLSFEGTYLKEFIVTPGTVATGGVTSYDCAGLYGGTTCGTTTGGGVPRPKWRHRLRATFTPSDMWQVSLAWRYVGDVKANTTSDNPFLTGAVYPVDAKLKAESYFDLNASVNVTKNVVWRVGVNNIFDKNPPLVGALTISASSGNGNTYPGVYDALGRYIYTSASLRF